jgi:hypothetical protein
MMRFLITPAALVFRWLPTGLAAAVLLLSAGPSRAEPYLAVESGLKCGICHTNPTGGGKRTLFGMVYARTRIAERRIFTAEDAEGWNSEVNRWLGIGGDYRGGYTSVDVPSSPDVSNWATGRGTAYLEVRALPGLVTIYADRQMAPGQSRTRESYLLVTPQQGKYSIKAGQFFLPFGLRLQDDATFVRQRSGINFDTPDEGIEFGLELPKWSAQVAFSDGTAGAGSISGKDQTSLSAQYVQPLWRVGASYNVSNDRLGDRNMQALFAGWRTGPISWLAELDFISDEVPGQQDRDTYATLIEGNWRLRPAHNLKAAYEFLDPASGIGDDEEERYSVVWEYSPIQLLQTRLGYRAYNGVANFPETNRDELFLEFHVYF